MRKIMMTAKITAFILSLSMGLSACAADADSADRSVSPDSTQMVREAGEMRDITSMELVKEMKIGWNLGNTLDVCAADRDGDGIVNEVPADGKVDETLWGNPMTTKKLFEELKADGINAVRIPVTWRDHLGEAPDYKIDSEWLDRVQEVVDYAYDLDMYVIINIHHDGGDDAKFGAWVRGAAKDYDKFSEKYNAIWSQICERFKNYSDKLIFESANEIGFDNLSKDDAYALLNRINQQFVDLVRASGGNNSKRHLLIAGYWTDIEQTCDERYKLPDDPENRLILSVHYYTPWEFCIINSKNTWGTDGDYNVLKNKMGALKNNFIDKGIPVIIGEYGFNIQTYPKSQVEFAGAVSKTCYDIGIRCFLWDNGEVFNRNTYEWRVDGLIEALQESVSGD